MKIQCPTCQETIPEGVDSCPNCGSWIKREEVTPPIQPDSGETILDLPSPPAPIPPASANLSPSMPPTITTRQPPLQPQAGVKPGPLSQDDRKSAQQSRIIILAAAIASLPVLLILCGIVLVVVLQISPQLVNSPVAAQVSPDQSMVLPATSVPTQPPRSAGLPLSASSTPTPTHTLQSTPTVIPTTARPTRTPTKLHSATVTKTVTATQPASISGDRKMQFEVISEYQSPKGIDDLTISPDGLTLASGDTDGQVLVFSLGKSKFAPTTSFIAHMNDEPARSLAFSPDGKWLATGGWDNRIRIWSLPSYDLVYELTGHTSGVMGLAFSSDSVRLYSGGYDGTVRVWTLGQPKSQQIANISGRVYSLAISPDGQTLAVGSDDQMIRLYDLSNLSQKLRLAGHSGSIWSLAFSPDGQWLASGGGSTDQEARLWQMPNGEAAGIFSGSKDLILGLAFTPDSKVLVGGGWENDTRLLFWRVSDQSLLASLSEHTRGISGILFGLNGSVMVTSDSDGRIILWQQTP